MPFRSRGSHDDSRMENGSVNGVNESWKIERHQVWEEGGLREIDDAIARSWGLNYCCCYHLQQQFQMRTTGLVVVVVVAEVEAVGAAPVAVGSSATIDSIAIID